MLKGTGFTNSIFCQFGGAAPVPATLVSPSEMQCVVPALPASALAAAGSGDLADARPCLLRVTDNSSWWSNGVEFFTEVAPSVRGVLPPVGQREGGTPIIVYGSRFPPSSLLFCRIGVATSLARWLNSTAVACSTPPSAAAGAVLAAQGGNGTVQLRVTSNGVHYSLDSVSYTYEGEH